MVEALQQKIIAGAALDVFENEPQVPRELRKRENVAYPPYLGSATQETREAMARLTFENLTDFFEGRALAHHEV